MSEQLLVLKLAFFHISQCFLQKRSQILPTGADHEVAGLLGQRFLEKIQNGGRRFTLDWLECLGWRRSFNNFIGSIHFFGFYWWLSYLAKLITSQNCTIMLRNLTFVVQFSYFSIRPKKVFFLASNCWATFVTTFDFFLATFWEIPGNVWKNLEQLVESPSYKVHWMVL